ncbi:carbon storage regulator CsrA [Moorella sp. Hama-1]|uniref:carbon storage regulator CsrA n=1 Tax=Moorella sp. Hama-1 TaxID=2138101 RepID=UPI000D658130|nr:carbon storage regulator CsrA [Moorella sp. Hama-1]BCV20778.1 carbon storage regulator [Moorella sp. Hama-1]
MLVLTRRVNEAIIIDNRIKVTIVGIEDDKVRIGIDAPPEVPIVRQELLAAVADENKAAAQTPAVALDNLSLKVTQGKQR